LLCCVAVAAGVVVEADADVPLRDPLVRAREAGERLADELRAENARLRDALAQRDAQIEQMAAELALLKPMASGRSSERVRPLASLRSCRGGRTGATACRCKRGDRGQGGGQRSGSPWAGPLRPGSGCSRW
jgi:hypothetical protein